jgi:hypothetical protein
MERLLAHPAERAVELAGAHGLVVGRHEQIAPSDVERVREPKGDRHRGHRDLRVVIQSVELSDRRRGSAGQYDDLVTDLERAGHDPPRVQPGIVCLWSTDPLDRQSQPHEVAVALNVELLQVLEQRRPVVERRVTGFERDVVPV